MWTEGHGFWLDADLITCCMQAGRGMLVQPQACMASFSREPHATIRQANAVDGRFACVHVCMLHWASEEASRVLCLQHSPGCGLRQCLQVMQPSMTYIKHADRCDRCASCCGKWSIQTLDMREVLYHVSMKAPKAERKKATPLACTCSCISRPAKFAMPASLAVGTLQARCLMTRASSSGRSPHS